MPPVAGRSECECATAVVSWPDLRRSRSSGRPRPITQAHGAQSPQVRRAHVAFAEIRWGQPINVPCASASLVAGQRPSVQLLRELAELTMELTTCHRHAKCSPWAARARIITASGPRPRRASGESGACSRERLHASAACCHLLGGAGAREAPQQRAAAP